MTKGAFFVPSSFSLGGDNETKDIQPIHPNVESSEQKATPDTFVLTKNEVVTIWNTKIQDIDALVSGLTLFINDLECKSRHLSPDKKHQTGKSLSVLLEYARESKGKCPELLNKWEEHHSAGVNNSSSKSFVLLVKVTRLLLERLMSNGDRNLASAFAISLIDTQLKRSCYRILHSMQTGSDNRDIQNRLVMETLDLLTKACSTGHRVSDLLFRSFDWSMSCLSSLSAARSHLKRNGATKRGSNPGQEQINEFLHSIRDSWIDFCFSFLKHGTREARIECGRTLATHFGSIISQMWVDPLSRISRIVSLIKELVMSEEVHDSSLARAFFSKPVLSSLVKLHSHERIEVGAAVDQLLKTLVTKTLPYPNSQHYIELLLTKKRIRTEDDKFFFSLEGNFGDGDGFLTKTSLSISVKNRLLLDFINHLRPLEAVPHQSLVIECLKACPDLIVPYLKHIQQIFSAYGDDKDGQSTRWVALMSLAIQIASIGLIDKLEINEKRVIDEAEMIDMTRETERNVEQFKVEQRAKKKEKKELEQDLYYRVSEIDELEDSTKKITPEEDIEVKIAYHLEEDKVAHQKNLEWINELLIAHPRTIFDAIPKEWSNPKKAMLNETGIDVLLPPKPVMTRALMQTPRSQKADELASQSIFSDLMVTLLEVLLSRLMALVTLLEEKFRENKNIGILIARNALIEEALPLFPDAQVVYAALHKRINATVDCDQDSFLTCLLSIMFHYHVLFAHFQPFTFDTRKLINLLIEKMPSYSENLVLLASTLDFDFFDDKPGWFEIACQQGLTRAIGRMLTSSGLMVDEGNLEKDQLDLIALAISKNQSLRTKIKTHWFKYKQKEEHAEDALAVIIGSSNCLEEHPLSFEFVIELTDIGRKIKNQEITKIEVDQGQQNNVPQFDATFFKEHCPDGRNLVLSVALISDLLSKVDRNKVKALFKQFDPLQNPDICALDESILNFGTNRKRLEAPEFFKLLFVEYSIPAWFSLMTRILSTGIIALEESLNSSDSEHDSNSSILDQMIGAPEIRALLHSNLIGLLSFGLSRPASLSSHVLTVLKCFVEHMNRTRFRERSQAQTLLQLVFDYPDLIDEKSPCSRFILAWCLFVAHTLPLVLTTKHPMYEAILDYARKIGKRLKKDPKERQFYKPRFPPFFEEAFGLTMSRALLKDDDIRRDMAFYLEIILDAPCTITFLLYPAVKDEIYLIYGSTQNNVNKKWRETILEPMNCIIKVCKEHESKEHDKLVQGLELEIN